MRDSSICGLLRMRHAGSGVCHGHLGRVRRHPQAFHEPLVGCLRSPQRRLGPWPMPPRIPLACHALKAQGMAVLSRPPRSAWRKQDSQARHPPMPYRQTNLWGRRWMSFLLRSFLLRSINGQPATVPWLGAPAETIRSQSGLAEKRNPGYSRTAARGAPGAWSTGTHVNIHRRMPFTCGDLTSTSFHPWRSLTGVGARK